jgi:hypothetical protein
MLPTTRVEGGYWLSRGTLHFDRSPVTNADLATFSPLVSGWARDKKRVYWCGSAIRKADVASFHVLNGIYARDAERCYNCGSEIKGAEAATFRSLDSGIIVRQLHNGFGDETYVQRAYQGYAADSNSVFHHVVTYGKPSVVKGADPHTFQAIGCGYAKDVNHVYFEQARVKQADPKSFVVVPPFWAVDENHVFCMSSEIPQADQTRFKVLSSGDYLSTDGSRFFNRNQEVSRDAAYPYGSAVPGYPLATARSQEQAIDYLRRGATPQDALALHGACVRGDFDRVKLLLEAGCNPQIVDAERESSILGDVYGPQSLAIIQALVAAGADVNHIKPFDPAKNETLMTLAARYHPLQSALFRNQYEVAEFLIAQGAHVDAETGEGLRLIQYMRKVGNAKAVQFLLDHGAVDL